MYNTFVNNAIAPRKNTDMTFYPMYGAVSCFWLVNNCEAYTPISRFTSTAWDTKKNECHLRRHNGDHERRPFFVPPQWHQVTVCLYNDIGQTKGISWIFKLQKCFRMRQTSFEDGINSLPLIWLRRYGNLPRAWYWDAVIILPYPR